MSLIITPTAPTLTTAQLEANVAREIKALCTQAFNSNVATFTRAFTLVWANPNGLTPQQVCTAMGTDAGALFASAAALKSLLNAQVANTITASVPTGTTVTVNTDGTVTITTA